MLVTPILLAGLVNFLAKGITTHTIIKNKDAIEGDLLTSSTGAVNSVLASVLSPGYPVVIVTDHTSSGWAISKAMSQVASPAGVSLVTPSDNINRTQTDLMVHLAGTRKLRLLYGGLTIVVASKDAEFLGLFATVAKMVRLLRWSTRVMLIMNYSFIKLRKFLSNIYSYTEMNTLAIATRDVDGVRWCDIYSYLPYSPMGPQLKRLAYWKSSGGLTLLEGLQLFPQKHANYYGAKKWVSAFMMSPYFVKKTRKTPDGGEEDEVSGREYLILQAIAKNMNVSFVVNQVNQVKKMAVDVQRGAFASVTKVAMLPSFQKVAEFTDFIEEATLTFCMVKPTLEPQWQGFYHPLTNSVWICVLVFLVVMPLFIKFVTKRDFTEGGEHVFLRSNVPSAILRTIGMFLWQEALAGLPRTSSTRVLVVTWLIFAFIIGTAYRGNLTAFLTVPKYPPRIETLEQLAHSNARTKFRSNGSTFYNYFGESDLFSYKAVYERADLVPTLKDGLKAVLKSKSAYFQERFNMELEIVRQYPAPDVRSRIYVAKENVMNRFGVWLVPKDAPYLDRVNWVIVAAREAGLIRKWIDDIMRQEKREILEQSTIPNSLEREDEDDKGDSESRDGRILSLTVVHIEGPLFLIVLGLSLALVTFGAEIIFHRCRNG